MNLGQLVNKLAQQGVTLHAEGNRLCIQVAQGDLDAEMRVLLEDFEEEILLWLAQQEGADTHATLPQVIDRPAERHQPFPLTDIQHAYWVGRSGSFALGDVSTHVYFELTCQPLEFERLNAAWQQIIARHEMLRAIVTADGQQQILCETPDWQITVYDLRDHTQTQIESHIATLRNDLSHQVLPADHWPLFDIRATHLNDETRLHLSLDVLFCDFASLLMILAEWQQLYQQPTLRLPAPKLSFRDYVLATQQMEATDVYQRAAAYWRKRLASLPPAPELPLAQEPALISQTRTQRRAARLDRQAWAMLQQRGQQQGLTANGVLLAAFAEVLGVWSKQPAFTLNLTLFNRLPLHPNVDEVIGDFTTINLLAVDNSQPAAFAERAQRLQKQLWDDLDHRAFSGVRVLRELAHQRAASAGGVQMPVIFTSGLGFAAGRGFQPFGELVYGISQTPQAWLDHVVIEEDGALTFSWDAVEALFPAGLLDDLFAAYCDLLQRLAQDATTWQMRHPVPLPTGQQQQRQAVNNTAAPLSDEMLHTLFLKQVNKRADQPAVITAQRTLSYAELYQRANQVSHWLRARAVRPNTLVAVVMEKGWEQVVAVLGIHLAGAAYLPIDPNLPSERQRYLLQQAEVVFALTQSKLASQLTWSVEIQTLAVDALTPSHTLASLETVQQPTDLAYVIYTSGSTGQPKGVMIDHVGAVNTVLDINRRFGVTAQDRVLALSALNFDLSVYDIFGLLAVGGAIVLPDPDLRNDPAHWIDLMTTHQVTLWDTVPALMQMLVDTLEARQGDKETRRQGEGEIQSKIDLRLVMLSGDWIPVTLPDRIKACWPGVTVYGLGGATEASIWSNYFLIEQVDPAWPSIPYGKPLTNQRFQVLDANLNPRPLWVTGDLYIGGIGLALGYWKDAEKTAAKFITHPQTGERLYKTGDLGRYLPDGNLEFLGREDFQVKIRGHRIELGEIEAALLQHPAIKEAVVNAVGDPKGNRQLVAYVVQNTTHNEHSLPHATTLQEQMTASAPQQKDDWDALIDAIRHQLGEEQSPSTVQVYLQQWEKLNTLYIESLYLAFSQFGVYQSSGDTYSLDDLMTHSRIAPRYRKWLQRALHTLVEMGELQQNGEQFFSPAPLPLASPDRIKTFTAPAVGEASTWLYRETALHLVDLLTEQTHSAELYADASHAQGVYQEGFSRVNRTLATVVQTWLKQQQTDLKILEVGAGYGTTTEHLLSLLPPQQTEYTFTDLSEFFLQSARQRFAAHPFLQYGILNLEHDPSVQGYPSHAFNLIIAASVLHVPRRIEETLQNLRTLLAPGGFLVMIEETQFHQGYDISMGLMQGFDRFEDVALRPFHPLLSRTQWQEQLNKAGFAQVCILNQTGSISDVLGIDVIMAQADAHFQALPEEDVPTQLRKYLSEKLPEYMVPMHYCVLDALPLTANGKIDRKALPLPDVQSVQERTIVPPSTTVQADVTAIWSEVLKVPQVGISEDFFELGGDSLLATQVLSRLRSTFKIDLSLRDFLAKPKVFDLAEHIGLLTTAQNLLPTIPLRMEEEEEVW
jgi:pyochelin synthetase